MICLARRVLVGTCLALCISFLIVSKAKAQSKNTLLGDADRRAIEDCRHAIPDATIDPSSPGGVSIITQKLALSEPEKNVCLYGSLAGSDVLKLVSIIEEIPNIDRLILRSTGGSVREWLTLSEAMQGRVKVAIVDELCFSSCANYAFIIAQKKHVPPDSLVVWHGGPTGKSFLSEKLIGEKERADILDLSKRTRALYKNAGVSIQLLEDTNSLTLTDEDAAFIQRQKLLVDRDFDIDGFALSPQTLARCYGVQGLELMWHPNTTLTVYGLGLIRSSDLRVLMRPNTKRIVECYRR